MILLKLKFRNLIFLLEHFNKSLIKFGLLEL